MGMPAAVVGSTATNTPHIPTPSNGTFQRRPANKGSVARGSSTVFINAKPAARDSDPANTCNDPADVPIGRVIAAPGSVWIGG
jgi:uncharacterized Zn-binding protein involved in type VI secretion